VKPYAESCDQNKAPILAVLKRLFADRRKVLEIGSGTGQHAVFFGAALPHLVWCPSDRAEQHAGIDAWRGDAGLPNVCPPLDLDVDGEWPAERYDAVFSANTAHILSWPQVQKMFEGVGRVLDSGGLLILYGPFNYGGRYTSESNARFDAWLKARDPASGIRDFEALDALAGSQGMRMLEDVEMPANNRILVWRKAGS